MIAQVIALVARCGSTASIGGSDTHPVVNDRNGFGEALDPSRDLLPDGLFDLPDGQISDTPLSLACPALFAKIFWFSECPNQFYISSVPSRQRGDS
jgi:hypothetical protein